MGNFASTTVMTQPCKRTADLGGIFAPDKSWLSTQHSQRTCNPVKTKRMIYLGTVVSHVRTCVIHSRWYSCFNYYLISVYLVLFFKFVSQLQVM